MKVSVARARELASKSRGSPMEHRFRRRASNFDERASCRDIRMPRRLLQSHGRRTRTVAARGSRWKSEAAEQRPTEALLAKAREKPIKPINIALNLGPHRLKMHGFAALPRVAARPSAPDGCRRVASRLSLAAVVSSSLRGAGGPRRRRSRRVRRAAVASSAVEPPSGPFQALGRAGAVERTPIAPPYLSFAGCPI